MMLDQVIAVLELVLLCVVLFLLMVVYVVAPLRIWQVQSFDPGGTFEKIEPEQLPAAVDHYFLQLTPPMAALGFVVVAYLRRPLMVAGLSAYLAQWFNRGSGQSATVVVVTSPAGMVMRACSLQFKTRLADGTTVETNNSNDVGLIAKERNYHQLQFPGVGNPDTLYQLHLWHEARRLDPHRPRFLPSEQHLIDHMNGETKRIYSFQVAAGRMIERNGRYHHTLGNAFRSAWKQSPPFRQIRKAWRTLAANRMKRQVLSGALRKSIPAVTTDVLVAGNSD